MQMTYNSETRKPNELTERIFFFQVLNVKTRVD